MNNKKIAAIIVALTSLFQVSCTKDFESINTDPERPKTINPGVMLGQVQYRMVNSTMTASKGFTHELMQVTSPRSSAGGGGLHRYEVNPGAGVWNSMYEQMTDVQDIYARAVEAGEVNYQGIALVYRSWGYSILTDLYGDIPYNDAAKAAEGKLSVPFDKQEVVYAGILSDLEKANSLFNTSASLLYGGDLLYNASSGAGMLKWKKFANSLRLRLLLRLWKRDGEINVKEQIRSILADPEKYPVFASNDDEAIFRYPGSFPYFNPYYNARQLDWRDGVYVSKFFINKMNADNDPRRAAWFTKVNNTYTGIESGYPVTVEYQVGVNSSYTDALKTLPQLGIMMTYAELEFIKAELVLKGFSTGKSAKQHYETAIGASMQQWGTTLPAGYLEQPGVVYNQTASVEKQLERIMEQKYYAYFFVDYQSWFEKRRTGYPVLPRGSGIPVENAFPNRVPYPGYLQSLNPENLAKAVASMGGDRSSIKVWWDK